MQVSAKISLRQPICEDHEDLLFRLYCEGRKGEVASFGWAENGALAFLRMQFEARETAYRFQFPALVDEIVLLEGEPVGRVLTSVEDGKLLLVDIAVLAAHQRSGIGTNVVRCLQAKAASESKPVLLRVDKTNLPAIGFYKKLGFVVDDESQIQYSMSWRPGDKAK